MWDLSVTTSRRNSIRLMSNLSDTPHHPLAGRLSMLFGTFLVPPQVRQTTLSCDDQRSVINKRVVYIEQRGYSTRVLSCVSTLMLSM